MSAPLAASLDGPCSPEVSPEMGKLEQTALGQTGSLGTKDPVKVGAGAECVWESRPAACLS